MMDLKNCPSCGGQDIMRAKILRGPERYGSKLTEWMPHRWFCECRRCAFRGPIRWTRKGAERGWNKWGGVILR